MNPLIVDEIVRNLSSHISKGGEVDMYLFERRREVRCFIKWSSDKYVMKKVMRKVKRHWLSVSRSAAFQSKYLNH